MLYLQCMHANVYVYRCKHVHNTHTYMYIYIYVDTCVCVCFFYFLVWRDGYTGALMHLVMGWDRKKISRDFCRSSAVAGGQWRWDRRATYDNSSGRGVAQHRPNGCAFLNHWWMIVQWWIFMADDPIIGLSKWIYNIGWSPLDDDYFPNGGSIWSIGALKLLGWSRCRWKSSRSSWQHRRSAAARDHCRS